MELIFSIMHANNIIFSDGSIVYFNKIFLNSNTHIYMLNQYNIMSGNFNISYIRPTFSKIFNMQTNDLDSHNELSLQIFQFIQTTMKPKITDWIILHNTRNQHEGKHVELNVNETIPYGSNQMSFMECLHSIQHNYQCEQIVYSKRSKGLFPMKKLIYDTHIGSNANFITAIRYPLNQFPRVAVIIPTYNRFYLLKRSIQSVVEQTYAYLDIIITDDAHLL